MHPIDDLANSAFVVLGVGAIIYVVAEFAYARRDRIVKWYGRRRAIALELHRAQWGTCDTCQENAWVTEFGTVVFCRKCRPWWVGGQGPRDRTRD